MRYKYKVRELGKEVSEDMEAMSLKKLRRKLDYKKEYSIEYTNKKGNYLVVNISGIKPKWIYLQSNLKYGTEILYFKERPILLFLMGGIGSQ